jgi:hypothetical protein
MAEVVTLVDDLDGSTENVTNHVIIIDGSAFTIDLSEKNVDKLHKAFQPFREKARPAGAAARQVTPLPCTAGLRKRASSGAGVDPKAVRVWADENKIDVPTRGRIPKPIIDQYVAATGR